MHLNEPSPRGAKRLRGHTLKKDHSTDDMVPAHIRSENGSEIFAKKVCNFLSKMSVRPLFIEPGSQWENGYIESFNGKMREELLD